VPMLAAGDEMGRTQQGNNNAYCQDNEVSWVDWDGADRELLASTAALLRLRREHRVLRSRHFPTEDARPGRVRLRWFAPDGSAMAADGWEELAERTIVAVLDDAHEKGRPPPPDAVLVVLHAGPGPVEVRLPQVDGTRGPWRVAWSSEERLVVTTDGRLSVPPATAALLTHEEHHQPGRRVEQVRTPDEVSTQVGHERVHERGRQPGLQPLPAQEALRDRLGQPTGQRQCVADRAQTVEARQRGR